MKLSTKLAADVKRVYAGFKARGYSYEDAMIETGHALAAMREHDAEIALFALEEDGGQPAFDEAVGEVSITDAQCDAIATEFMARTGVQLYPGQL